MLFRNLDARFLRSFSKRPRHWASKLLEVIKNPLASHTKTLNFGFGSIGPTHNDIEADLLEAVFGIPTLVRAGQKLRALRSSGPSKSLLGFQPDHDGIYRGPSMNLVEQTLRLICLDTYYPALDTVEKRLPLAYDYDTLPSRGAQYSSTVAKRPRLQFKQSLLHLEVAVSDCTGLGGQRYSFERSQMATGDT